MSCLADLKQHQLVQYQRVLQCYRSIKPYVSPFDQNELIDLYREHGEDVLTRATNVMGRKTWRDLEDMKIVAACIETHGWDKVDAAVRTTAAEGWKSPGSLERFLSGSMKTKAQTLEAKNDPRAVQTPAWPAMKDRRAEHIYNWVQTQQYLNQIKGVNTDAWPEYFDRHGFSEPCGKGMTRKPLFILKPEYR